MAGILKLSLSESDWLFDYQSKLIHKHGSANVSSALIHLDFFGEGRAIVPDIKAYNDIFEHFTSTTADIFKNPTHQDLINEDIRCRGSYAAWIFEANRKNLERPYRRYFHLTLFKDILAPQDNPETKNPLWDMILGSEENRNLYFEELYETGLLGYFLHFSNHGRAYTKEAPTQIVTWMTNRKPRLLDDVLVNTPIPNMDDYNRSFTSYLSFEEIMAARPAGYASPVRPKGASKALLSEYSQEEIDRSIARNQAYFNETPPKYIAAGYCLALGVEFKEYISKAKVVRELSEEKDNPVKVAWNYIDHHRAWPPNVKKLMLALTFLSSRPEDSIHLEENERAWKAFLSPDRIEKVFKSAQRNGILAELYFFANAEGSYFPAGTTEALIAWYERNNNEIPFRKMLAAYNPPIVEVKPLNPEAPDVEANPGASTLPPPAAAAAEERLPRAAEAPPIIYLGHEQPLTNPAAAVEKKPAPAANAPDIIYLGYEPPPVEAAPEQTPPPEAEKPRFKEPKLPAAEITLIFDGDDRQKYLKKIVVGKNQRFFDELSVDKFAVVFAAHLGIDIDTYNKKNQFVNDSALPKPTTFFKTRGSFIDRQPFDDNMKKFMLLNDLNNLRANQPENAAKGFSDLGARIALFERMRKLESLPEFYYLIHAKALNGIPAVTVLRNHFVAWSNEYVIGLGAQLAAYEFPSLKPAEPAAIVTKENPLPPAPPSRRTLFSGIEGVKEIIIKGDSFVQTGQVHDLLNPRTPRRLKEDFEKAGSEKPRIEWLIDAIKTRMTPDVGTTINGYSLERTSKGFNADGSYGVIEFVHDGRRHQIVTSNLPDRGTYVIKPAIDIDVHAPNVDIAMLLGSGKAWPRRCDDEKQFTRDVLDYCQKEASDIPPYIAPISWADQKRADIISACVAFSEKTGRMINRDAIEPFDYDGVFYGITTPARMADAINRGVISEIGKTTVTDFYRSVEELSVCVEQPSGRNRHVNSAETAAAPPPP